MQSKIKISVVLFVNAVFGETLNRVEFGRPQRGSKVLLVKIRKSLSTNCEEFLALLPTCCLVS